MPFIKPNRSKGGKGGKGSESPFVGYTAKIDATEGFEDYEVVKVKLKGRFPNKMIQGTVTFRNYGHHKSGDVIEINIKDYEAAPNRYEIIGRRTVKPQFSFEHLPGIGEKTAKYLSEVLGLRSKKDLYLLGQEAITNLPHMRKTVAKSLWDGLKAEFEDEDAEEDDEDGEPDAE
jgi:hypothetical protein